MSDSQKPPELPRTRASVKYDPFATGGSPWARDMIILLRMRSEWSLSVAFATPANSRGLFTKEFTQRTELTQAADAALLEAMKAARGRK